MKQPPHPTPFLSVCNCLFVPGTYRQLTLTICKNTSLLFKLLVKKKMKTQKTHPICIPYLHSLQLGNPQRTPSPLPSYPAWFYYVFFTLSPFVCVSLESMLYSEYTSVNCIVGIKPHLKLFSKNDYWKQNSVRMYYPSSKYIFL